MPKKDKSGDEFIFSEYGNWNVASDYSRLKIMKPLYLADEYEIVATFGTLEFFDELTSNLNTDFIKIKAFRRLIKTLILLINNSLFAIKGNEKTTLKDYKKELTKFYKIIPLLSKMKVNQVKGLKDVQIVKEKFDRSLERVSEIKMLINEPLNKYDLIFTHKEEMDPTAYKEKLIKDAVSKG